MRTAAALLMSIALGGCTVMHEGKYAWRDGWRAGQIRRVGAAAAMPWRPDCVAAGPGAGNARYATVEFPRSRSAKLRVLPIPDDSFEVGSPVLFNASDCSVPMRHRVQD